MENYLIVQLGMSIIQGSGMGIVLHYLLERWQWFQALSELQKILTSLATSAVVSIAFWFLLGWLGAFDVLESIGGAGWPQDPQAWVLTLSQVVGTNWIANQVFHKFLKVPQTQ